MSLILARLCGEWRLASGKYEEVRSGKTKYSRYEYFDNIEENGKPLREIRKPLQKVEMRQRNRKAVEEDFLGFLGNWKAVEENRILSEENRSFGEGKSPFSQDILEFLAILGSRFDTKYSTTCVHGFT